MSLTDMVLMPGADYQQICDNLRTALGTEAVIKSHEAAELTAILQAEMEAAEKSAGIFRDNLDAFISGPNGSYRNSRVTKIRDYALYFATGLNGYLEFSNATIVGMGAFRNCSNLLQVMLPVVATLGNNAFNACSKLQLADIGNTVSISSSTFTNCAALKVVVIRKSDGPATLTNISAFNGTPFASGNTGGTIYVPTNLMEAYKAATNWSTLYAQGTCEFAALEGSEYE